MSLHNHTFEETAALGEIRAYGVEDSFPTTPEWRDAYRAAARELLRSADPYEQACARNYRNISNKLGTKHPPKDPDSKTIFHAASLALYTYRLTGSFRDCVIEMTHHATWDDQQGLIYIRKPGNYAAIDPRYTGGVNWLRETPMAPEKDIRCFRRVIENLPADCRIQLIPTV